MKALYVTDLHGDERKYLKAFEVAKDTGAGLIINGGDMLPKHGNRHRQQPLFLNRFLKRYFAELKKQNITYLAMLSNDDLLAVDAAFSELCDEFDNVFNIAGKKAVINGYEFIGMDRVLDHPFGCKDRVITETRYIPQAQLSPVALLSSETGYDEIHDWFSYAEEGLPYMCDVLNDLPEPDDPGKTVYVMHMPPAWLKLGQLLYQNLDIGSADIYDFLKEQQPLLSLHGHIHESPDTANGRWINSIGCTSCIQPGQTELYEDKMVLVELDLDSEKYERIVISVE